MLTKFIRPLASGDHPDRGRRARSVDGPRTAVVEALGGRRMCGASVGKADTV